MQANPKFITVLIHGLNFKPEKLCDLKTVFEELDSFVITVALLGHRSTFQTNTDEMKNVSLNRWMNELQTQCEYAYKLAEKHNCPIVFCGFSLGALLMELYLNKFPEYKVKQKIYLAPALALHRWSHLKILLKFIPERLIFKGLTPEPYNASKGASIAAYKALFEAHTLLLNSKFKSSNISTLVIADKKDELVNVAGVKKLLQTFKLDQWNFFEVTTKDSEFPKKMHHLIAAEKTLGNKEWLRMKNKITDFLIQ